MRCDRRRLGENECWKKIAIVWHGGPQNLFDTGTGIYENTLHGSQDGSAVPANDENHAVASILYAARIANIDFDRISKSPAQNIL